MDTNRTGTATQGKGRRSRAISLIAAGTLLALTLGAGTALADGNQDHRNAENTFTKHITEYPAMAGVVGGDVGAGTYSGEILSLAVTGTGLEIDAAYHFSGSIHSFTAMVHVSQTGFDNGATAVITGQVTDGWLHGNVVQGEYTQIACSAGTCYQGTLDILRGSKD